jgi:hypothetical protein
VDTELLDANKVFTVGNAAGDLGGVGGCEKMGQLWMEMKSRSEQDILPKSHVAEPPEKLGPMSLILNHPPLPS